MRMTVQEAISLGALKPRDRGVSSSKRAAITQKIQDISLAHVSIKKNAEGFLINIEGVSAPSWNAVLGWDKKTVYASYNKAWRKRMYEAALEYGMRKERSSDAFMLEINVRRKRLLDYDNVCVKQILDGIRHSGIIMDDDPRYIQGYMVRQEKALADGVSIFLRRC